MLRKKGKKEGKKKRKEEGWEEVKGRVVRWNDFCSPNLLPSFNESLFVYYDLGTVLANQDAS